MRRWRVSGLWPLALLWGCATDPTRGGGSGSWAAVTAGDQFTCGLRKTGQAYCWGLAIFGQLGDGGTTRQTRPVAVAGGHLFTSINAGSDHVCAVATDGKTWCWGLNDLSELGVTTSWCNATFQFAHCARSPLEVTGAPAFASIVVNGYASCGLTGAGSVFCWGWNDHGQTGSGAVGDTLRHPTLVPTAAHFASISMDLYHACGLTAASALYCWGSNDFGQLGSSPALSPVCGSGFPCSVSPTPIGGLLALQASAGSSHTCAVDTANDLWCWGSNQYGALGNSHSLGGHVPVKVEGGLSFASVDAGFDHTCALTPDGAAYCWGLNTWFQLGVISVSEACLVSGSAAPCRTSPIAVATSLRFASLSAGTDHTCGVSLGGDIWCWGKGIAGQLGNGETASSADPVLILEP